MENVVKLKGIKPDAVINIKVGTGYYQRIQSLLLSYIGSEQERAIKAIEDFKTREPVGEFEENLLTILTLIYAIEEGASQQGLMQDNEYKVNKA